MFFCGGTECSSSPGDYRSRAKRRSPWKAIPYIGRLSAAARLEGRIRSNVRHFSREEIRSLSFLSLRVSRHAPDGHTGSRLDSRFEGTKSCFLACASGNKQNVIALKGHVWFLSVENIFHVHLQLFALIGLALQPQDAGMPRVSTYVESFGERNCL